MPTVILNAGMSLVPDRSVPVRSDDRLAVIAPMYNEARGAAGALASLLQQQHMPDELAVSVNGGTDATYEVVVATLRAHGYVRCAHADQIGLGARTERWRHPVAKVDVLVLQYRHQTAKSESINNLVQSGLLEAERILVVDGDTVFRPDFIAALRDNFYRLRWTRSGEKVRAVIEDVALQSGTVTSFVPQGGGMAQRFISVARSAEYAVAGMLRTGQSRHIGNSALFGASRLFTVVGCGFAARRDLFPMPSDTLTEDHDLTLSAQSMPCAVQRLTPRAMADRGLRPVIDGVERSPEDVFDAQDALELRRGAGARFVREAAMFTEDPPHLSGYLRQIERWNGGSIQNALKRILERPTWEALTANVRFAVLASVIENVLGLLLWLALPILLAVHMANPSQGMPLSALIWWFGADAAVSLLLVAAGRWGAARSQGASRPAALGSTAANTLGSLVPYLLLRYLNPISYIAAASRVVPAYLRERGAMRRGVYKITRGVPWERPIAHRVSRRTAGTAASVVVIVTLASAASYAVIPRMGSITADAWRLTYQAPAVDMNRYDELPVRMPGGRSLDAMVPKSMWAARYVDAGPAASDAVLQVSWSANPGTLAALAVGVAQDPWRAAATTRSGPRLTYADVFTLAPGGVGPLEEAVGARALDRRGPEGMPRLGHGEPASRATLSSYCSPDAVVRADPLPHDLDGAAGAYEPLTPFDHLMLARLAPIEPLIVSAASAYDVPATLLAQVLVNESYLDPLAVGATGDKGLSQMTTDALTMLRSMSSDKRSAWYNPVLMSQPFNVYDPDFSICGGAAKLSWALAHAGADRHAEAYALYINPMHGLVDGRVSERQRAAVDAMLATKPLLLRLGSAYAAYREDPARLSAADRALLDISSGVSEGDLDVGAAYARSYAWVVANRIDDRSFYQSVLSQVYGADAPTASEAAGASVVRR